MRIVIALLIMALPILLSMGLKRRYRVPYALLTVGMLTYIGAFFVQYGLFQLLPSPLLNSPVIGGAITALVVGSTDMLARALGYHYLAKSVVNRGQASMIGIGYAALPAFFIGFSLLNIGLARWQANVSDVPAEILAEGLINGAVVCLSLALSWLVLQTFMRGQLGWMFGAMLWAGIVAGTDYFLQHATYDPTPATVLWWGLVAIVSLGIYGSVRSVGEGHDPPLH